MPAGATSTAWAEPGYRNASGAASGGGGARGGFADVAGLRAGARTAMFDALQSLLRPDAATDATPNLRRHATSPQRRVAWRRPSRYIRWNKCGSGATVSPRFRVAHA